MSNKSSHEYICLNKSDEDYLEDHNLEDLLDTQERKNAPLRTENIRKSIEHHLERQRLKQRIADFDWKEQDFYEEH
jgi:hypothetical protein